MATPTTTTSRPPPIAAAPVPTSIINDPYRSGRWSAAVGAIAIEIACTIQLFLYSGITAGVFPVPSEGHGTSNPLPSLIPKGRMNPDYLNALWHWNQRAFNSMLGADFLLAFALLLLVHSVYCLKKYYPRSVGTARDVMLVCFAVASVIPTIQFLQNLGARTVALWIFASTSSTKGLVSLEMAYSLGGARISWIYGVVYIAVAAGLLCQAYIGVKTGRSSNFHVAISISAALMGLVCFALNISLYFRPDLRPVWGFASLLWAMFLMPAWLIGIWSQLEQRDPRVVNQGRIEF